MIPMKSLENNVLYWGEQEYPMYWVASTNKFIFKDVVLSYFDFKPYQECIKPNDVSKQTRNKIIIVYNKLDKEFKELYKNELFELLKLKEQYSIQYRILSFYSNLGKEYINVYKKVIEAINKPIFSIKSPERRYSYFNKVLRKEINKYDYKPKSSFTKADKKSIWENWEEMKKLLDKKDS